MNSHNHPSLPSHPLSIVQSYHAPSYQQQPLPSISAAFHASFHPSEHHPLHHLPHHPQWPQSFVPFTAQHAPVPALHPHHSLPPLVSTPQNTPTPGYRLVHLSAPTPSQHPKSRHNQSNNPTPTPKRTRSKTPPPPATKSSSNHIPTSSHPTTNNTALRTDPALSRFSVYGDPLTPRETVPSAATPSTRQEALSAAHTVQYVEERPDAGAAADQRYEENHVNQIAARNAAPASRSTAAVAAQNQQHVHQVNIPSCETWATHGPAHDHVDVNAATNNKVRTSSQNQVAAAQDCSATERIETPIESMDSQRNVESAAECLATLAQVVAVRHEHDRRVKQKSSKKRTPNCHRHVEKETEREDPTARRRRRMNSKSGAHLKQAESKNVASNFGMQNEEMQNNLADFVSASTYSTSIPGLPPTHLAETQPTPSLPSSAAMHLLDTTRADSAKATPAGIRDTRNLFTKRPPDTLPDLSRNHSLVTDTTHLHHCTPPIQHQHQPVNPHPASSSNPANLMYHTHHLARPLFQESPVVTSPAVPHQVMAPAMLPQTAAYVYPSQTHSNLLHPQYRLQPCVQHQNDIQHPIPQSPQPSKQPSHPPQFQQPSQRLSQPANELLQSSQQLHETPSQISHPALQFSPLPQTSTQPSPRPSKSSQQRQASQSTGIVSDAGRVSKVKKRPTKKPAQRNTSDPLKPAKPKKKRTANKSAALKRPRAPKNPQTASSLPGAQAPGGNPCTPSVPVQTQLPSIPPLAVPNATKPPTSGLRIQAKLRTQKAAFLPHAPAMSPNTENLSQPQVHHNSKQPSALVQGNAREQSHLHSSSTQQHAVLSTPVEDGNVMTGRCAVDDALWKTRLENPKRGNAFTKKKRAVIKKAHNATEKAQQEAREVQSVPVDSTTPFATKSTSQHRQQILRLHPSLPPPTLQSATLPSTASTALPSFRNLKSAQQSVGSQLPPVVSAYQPVFTGHTPSNVTTTMRHPSEGARTAAAPTHDTQAPSNSVDQVKGTSSPRTESTQQTLPPDTYSLSPSDMGCLLDADDNVPLSQTRDRTQYSSVAKPSDGQPSLERIGGKSHQQSGAYGMFQQGPSKLILAQQNNAVFAGASQVENPVFNNTSTPLNPAKRKRAAKSSSPNKRRKKNPTNTHPQESSTNKRHAEANKGIATVMEDGTQNGDAKEQSDQKVRSVPKRVPVPKKSGKGQNKNKTTQQAKSVRKRASPSNKTQRKSKPNQSKSGEASPASDGGSGLRLCLHMQKEDGQQSSEAMTDPNEDSCDSPVAVEKPISGPKRASKSPQKKGNKAQRQTLRIVINAGDKNIQSSPCFAEELKNLRSSGILTTTERSLDPSSDEGHDEGISKIHDMPCALCQQRGSRNDMVKHPCYPLRVFDICKPCSDTVSKRVEGNGAKRKEAEVTSEKVITEQTTLFVMLIEEMVRHFSPSDREQRDVDRVYEFISNRNWSEMVERADSLSINFDMLTVVRVMLRKIGFSLRGGKLRWPVREFILPSIADTRALISNSIPARIEDLKKGILPGEAAWDKTFPEHEKFSLQRSTCAIYEKVFGLIGLKLVHVGECSAQNSTGSSCEVKFDVVSMGALMFRTTAMLSGTVTQELLTKCWTKEEALRIINEVETERLSGSLQGAIQSCCICGGSGKHLGRSATSRFSNCTECLKSFCSICLLNVLGTSEYLRSFEEDGYCCMSCRLHKNAELRPGSKVDHGKNDHRVRLRENAGIKKGAERRIKSLSPLLLLSQKIRADVLLRSELHASRKSLGFAMFCEVVNENSVRCGINPHSDQNLHDMCLECKLPVDDKGLEGESNDSLRCGQDSCPNVMHKSCIAPQRQIRRRGSRSKWCCPHHQCSKCEQHDESKLLRCRTCPVTYCKEHMPLPSEVYVFSDKSFACFKCRSSLRIPQPLHLKLPCSKSERKRNAIAQALAIDQRRRSSAVKKLSEGPGTRCFEPTAFNELRITT